MPDSVLPSLPKHPGLSTEFRLLTASSWIAPPQWESFQRTRIAGLCAEIPDWDAFLALVVRHRVPALVHTSLQRHGNGQVPDDLRRRLKIHSDQIRVGALQQVAEWLRLAHKLAEAGIEMLPLKGIILSQYLFGDPTLRHTKDLDLLVRPEDLDRTILLLEKEGYRLLDLEGFAPTPKQWRFLLTVLHHLVLFHPGRHLLIELHWNCEPWKGDQVAELWHNRVPFPWQGTRFSIPDDDQMLLYLCHHGAEHAWFRVKWLSDIAALLSRQRPEGWSNAVAMASRCGRRRALAQTVILVKWLYEIPQPEELTALVRTESSAPWLARKALQFMRIDTDAAARDAMRRHPYHLRLNASWRRVAALRKWAVSPNDFRRFRISDRFFWLYFLMRPLFWTWRRVFPTPLKR